jgi:hypothetical protein
MHFGRGKKGEEQPTTISITDELASLLNSKNKE